MPWSAIRNLSLLQGTLAVLVPVMLLVSAIELADTRASSGQAADAAYDRSILGAIKAIDANVSTASEGLSIELPYVVLELFELTASGSVNFRVATTDGLVELGSPDLPRPPVPLEPGQPVFYDATYFGESVRVGALKRALDKPLAPGGDPTLVIQVAESTRSRQQFSDRFLGRAMTRDAVFLALMIAAVTFVVTLALRPVSRLAKQVRARAPSDLAPLETQDLPSDLRPLVNAVNDQMARTGAILDERRRFIDDASHQLRTPLTTLRTLADLAARESRPEELKSMVVEIARQLENATRSTNQILSLARSDLAAFSPAPLELAELAREVAVAMLPRARAKGQDLGLEAPPALAATGDAGLLREAVLNLADNAIRYCPPRSEITIVASRGGGEFSLGVVDDGPGVSADEIEKLGTRFHRGRRHGAESGSGLGLAIARSIAERHGGRLVLEAAGPAKGLRARIVWPEVS